MHLVTSSYRKRQGAFTLIELLVTISVLGVLMAIALPNLRDFIVANRLSSNVNGFIGLLSYARSEAIVRNKQVIICAKDNSSNSCVSDQQWGMYETQIFVDEDGSDGFNAGDTLLKTLPALDVTGVQFAFFKRNANPISIKFQTGGFAMSPVSFDMKEKSTDSAYETKYGRTVCISKPGRARVMGLTTNPCS